VSRLGFLHRFGLVTDSTKYLHFRGNRHPSSLPFGSISGIHIKTMRTPHINTTKLLLLFAFVSIAALPAFAQTNQARSLVTTPVNEAQMVTLRGNTHPMARTEFDQGAAPGSLPMQNMQLVLRRTPEQEMALEELMREQQEPSSPDFHKWVTPEEFGARFGPSDHDIKAVTSWLQSHGLQVLEVSPGRNIIQFSGTASQVEATLHTSIHSYVVRGEQHWANSNDPQIPAALADVVAGVNTLHNFHRKPMSRMVGTFSRSNATGEVRPVHPNFTFSTSGDCGFIAGSCFAVGPADFATIYNVPSTLDGSGQTIGIVGDSNLLPADVANFRSIFGLPAKAPVVTIADNGTDPGIQPNGDELESDLDVEWAGAVAKNATINFVIAANTNTANGVDLAAEHIINHNMAAVLSESFGDCEFQLGTSGNAFFNSLWAQAAAQGITVVVSTGDNGSPSCDFPSTNANGSIAASSGLEVSGIASTPFNVAVGGTDFDQLSGPAAFWNSTNTNGTQNSAKGYIPETTWNDSCTNFDWTIEGFDVLPELSCNDAQLIQVINPIGGSGGVSGCTTSDFNPNNGTGHLTSCAGGYSKPDFQVAPGVPNDGKRDVPDISLFAGDGLIGSFFAVCEQDANTPANTPCSLSNPNSDIIGVGGTSASAQAFAGIMALIVQKTGSRQGIGVNTVMYQLAAAQSSTACNSSAAASTCVFHDVTKGTIAQPCVKSSPNCTTVVNNDSNGVLAGCDAAPGFDLATGLGTPNVGNLITNYSNAPAAGAVDFAFSLANCTSTVVITSPGNSGSFTAVITEMNGFNGAITFACSGLPSEATCSVATTNIDATHISATVTVATTAASRVIPQGRPASPGSWPLSGTIVLACLLGLGMMLIGFRAKQQRLSSVLALMALAIVATMAACGGSGGGGGGGGNAGTPTGSSTATLTATSGTTVHSMNFTLNVY
jgi:hypothetical protein